MHRLLQPLPTSPISCLSFLFSAPQLSAQLPSSIPSSSFWHQLFDPFYLEESLLISELHGLSSFRFQPRYLSNHHTSDLYHNYYFLLHNTYSYGKLSHQFRFLWTVVPFGTVECRPHEDKDLGYTGHDCVSIT